MIDKIKNYVNLILRRHIAYNRVFDIKSPHVETVLFDLARFCRAHEPTFHKDERLHALLEGRREVWLRIMENLKMTPDEIYDLHKIREFIPDKE